jgi:hypothetical protein
MVSSSPVPWYNCPAREFPARRWLRQRYPFSVSPQVFARQPTRQAALGQRPFPALVWARQQPILRARLRC